MTPSLTERLCTRCALCCDGSLFADVELTGREPTRLEVLGLEVEDDGADGRVLSLPCGALQGKRCGIYPHRPQCCRTFECRLLQDVRQGAVSEERARVHIVEAQFRIGRANEMLAQLGQHDPRLPFMERCAEALAKGPCTDPAVNRRRTELEAEMVAIEGLIRKTFLRPGRGRARRKALA